MEISKFAYSESRVTNFFYLCGSLWVEDISKETLLLSALLQYFLLRLRVLMNNLGEKKLTSQFQAKFTQN